MKSRSLLKEPPTPSVCAFCAYRFRQTRRPSHVQCRFLQASRPASRPPSEASAVQEDNSTHGFVGLGGQGPSWGRPSVGDGRAKVVLPAPAWGKGLIPGRSSDPGPSWGNNDVGEAPASSNSTATLSANSMVDELLPHERAARDRMLANLAKRQQRPVNIVRGSGPESTRAGRPMPKTNRQHLESARESVFRREARERSPQSLLERRGWGAGKYVMGDGDSLPPPVIGRDEHRGHNWSQLRRSAAPRHAPVPQEKTFAEARAEREEQTKFGRYVPLGGSRERSIWSEKRSSGSSEGGGSHSIANDSGSFVRYSPFRDVNPNTSSTEQSNRDFQPQSTPVPAAMRVSEDARMPVSNSKAETGNKNSSKSSAAKEAEKRKEEEEVDERRSGREKRRKAPRQSQTEKELAYNSMPKGKDRDKAKRRMQFSSSQEAREMEQAEEEARKRTELKKQRKREKTPKKPVPILLPEYISVSNLAIALRVKQELFIEKMQELGFEEFNHDYILNSENAGLIAMEYNYEPIIDRGESEDLLAMELPEDPSTLPPRPPVVTIMGHVDHGKTTLLDYLRKSSVAATEHGGITQHIGAFSVPMSSGKTITFLDTPGHAAFLSMRQRGANVTDIVILVIAADDSVMPQTIEAINHAKAANVPMIVAINKVDKPDSNIDKVKQDLARHNVDIEDFGGDTQVVLVSGKTGDGLDKLEDAVVALSDILDMRAQRDGRAEGWVIEASIKSMGKCATVLVRRGTMRPGDFIVAGNTWARIRCLRNEAGVEIEEAGPGTPVEIDGWREQPLAGDEVLQAPTEDKSKSVVDYRLEREDRNKMAEDMEAINENRKVESDRKTRERLVAQAAAEGVELKIPEQTVGGPKEVYFIIKGDVSGSVEAVIDSISVLGNKEVHPYILRSGVGQLSEFDVEHADAAKGHLINFNTTVEPHIATAAARAKVSIIDQNIIYRLVDEVKAELSKHLPPLVTQRVIGEADISMVFSVTIKGRKVKNIAGCKVRNGTIGKAAKVRVLRGGEKVFDGMLSHPNTKTARILIEL
ncbi:hypothetical protein BJ875DRAFT_467188, partial [Amylocarpus encephaloides]